MEDISQLTLGTWQGAHFDIKWCTMIQMCAPFSEDLGKHWNMLKNIAWYVTLTTVFSLGSYLRGLLSVIMIEMSSQAMSSDPM